MATTVNIFEAKTQLSKLIELAEKGEDVVIARAGKPVARLTRLHSPKEADCLWPDEGQNMGFAMTLTIPFLKIF